jgi:hypothetical protein
VPAFVVYLAGFEQIHQLSQGLDSLAFYRDYPNAFAEFSCWSSDSDIEDVYTPLPSIEIDCPPELLEPRGDPDPSIRALKQRLEAVKGKPQPLHGGVLEFGLLLPALPSEWRHAPARGRKRTLE